MKTLQNTKLNRRERKAQQLLAHYARCEALGRYLGMTQPDGKKISVALWKAERDASTASVKHCNGEYDGGEWTSFSHAAECTVKGIFGTLPPGFFVNGDPRGYALKIDNENPQGLALIRAVGLQTDMGGYGILSPEIDGGSN